MVRLNVAVLALAASVLSVACGGSQSPAKDPTTAEAEAAPPAPPSEKASKAPDPPGLSLGGTGSGSAQGSGNMGH